MAGASFFYQRVGLQKYHEGYVPRRCYYKCQPSSTGRANSAGPLTTSSMKSTKKTRPTTKGLPVKTKATIARELQWGAPPDEATRDTNSPSSPTLPEEIIQISARKLASLMALAKNPTTPDTDPESGADLHPQIRVHLSHLSHILDRPAQNLSLYQPTPPLDNIEFFFDPKATDKLYQPPQAQDHGDQNNTGDLDKEDTGQIDRQEEDNREQVEQLW